MKPHFILSLLVISLALLAVGCLSKPASSAIDLADLRALEPVADEGVIPLRIAIAAVLSPQGTLESYQPLLDYMGEQLNRPIQLIQRRTYQEVNILIEQGEVDVAFVCTGAYVAGSRDFGMELLAVPQVNGETVYHSYLIVAASSAADDLMDLRGATFAFTDPMSMTGFFYPSSLVRTLGNEPETFFSRIFFTYSHDKAINAVASGVADAAAVDSLVYDAA
ncbi:MAG TPA: PhnD/SsuA/transferrin family substrate-binding protein, partial [Bellilinea sp.]|nr:PhnD/SsuA/transferrin family substrate-binding protein [Bellilinea sp.]